MSDRIEPAGTGRLTVTPTIGSGAVLGFAIAAWAVPAGCALGLMMALVVDLQTAMVTSIFVAILVAYARASMLRMDLNCETVRVRNVVRTVKLDTESITAVESGLFKLFTPVPVVVLRTPQRQVKVVASFRFRRSSRRRMADRLEALFGDCVDLALYTAW